MPIRSIHLAEHEDPFVDEQIEFGRYKNASEGLSAGLRLLEQHLQSGKEKVALLRTLAEDGFRPLDQGEGVRIPNEVSLRNFITQIGQRVAKLRDTPSGQ
jgi:putative addiction module CopG family antidote